MSKQGHKSTLLASLCILSPGVVALVSPVRVRHPVLGRNELGQPPHRQSKQHNRLLDMRWICCMFQKSLRHSCSSGVFLSWASRLAFLQETARIFTKASPKDANSVHFGRFQPFSAGWSKLCAFRNASVFSKSDFEAENGLFSIFRDATRNARLESSVIPRFSDLGEKSWIPLLGRPAIFRKPSSPPSALRASCF